MNCFACQYQKQITKNPKAKCFKHGEQKIINSNKKVQIEKTGRTNLRLVVWIFEREAYKFKKESIDYNFSRRK